MKTWYSKFYWSFIKLIQVELSELPKVDKTVDIYLLQLQTWMKILLKRNQTFHDLPIKK